VARKIFKSSEVTEIGSRVIITPPRIGLKKETPVSEPEKIEELGEPEEEVKEVEIEEVALPDVEEQRKKLVEEAKRIKEQAEVEAKRIKEEAEQTAFKMMQKNTVDLRKAKEEAKQENERIIGEAQEKAQKIIADANKKAEEILKEVKIKSYEEGREEGFKKGEEEVTRLIDRLHVIINKAIDKRKEILEHTEIQMVDLIMMIVRKVVKVISEHEKNVVIENVKEALNKVKGDTEVVIRVNTQDLALATKHKKEFISGVESLENVRIEEDSRIDPGGCIIETSFGEIDARIQTQLGVLEEKIRELTPIKRSD